MDILGTEQVGGVGLIGLDCLSLRLVNTCVGFRFG